MLQIDFCWELSLVQLPLELPGVADRVCSSKPRWQEPICLCGGSPCICKRNGIFGVVFSPLNAKQVKLKAIWGKLKCKLKCCCNPSPKVQLCHTRIFLFHLFFSIYYSREWWCLRKGRFSAVQEQEQPRTRSTLCCCLLPNNISAWF